MRLGHSGRWLWLLVAAGIVALFLAWATQPRPRVHAVVAHREHATSLRSAVATRRVLPPDNAPLLSGRADLQEYAEEGDATAASRLFNDMAWCIKRARMQGWLADLQADPLWGQSAEAYFHGHGLDDPTKQREALASIQRNVQRVLDTQRMCEGTAAVLSDGSIYWAMVQAARLGDTAASACALVAPYVGPKLTPQQAAAYADETWRYAETALRKGSWANVFALASVSGPHEGDGGDNGYEAYTYRTDPAMQLRYWALMRRGMADGTADAKVFDGGIAALSASVTPAQRNEALRWADETYAKYFSVSGPSRAEMSLCEY